MNKITYLILIIITLGINRLNAQEIIGQWKPPLLPVAITYSTVNGWGIKGTKSIATPIGQFSISSSTFNLTPASTEQNKNKIINERVVVEKPVYRDRIEYKVIKGKDKIVKVPVVKEVVKEVIVMEKEYLLVIRNRDSNSDMLFIIKGVDELEAEVEGHSCILAKEGQIIIDITDAEISQIKFRGKEVDYTKPKSLVKSEKEPRGKRDHAESKSMRNYSKTPSILLSIWTDSPNFSFKVYIDGVFIGNCEEYFKNREPICGQNGTVSDCLTFGTYLVEIFSQKGKRLDDRRVTINPGDECITLLFSRN